MSEGSSHRKGPEMEPVDTVRPKSKLFKDSQPKVNTVLKSQDNETSNGVLSNRGVSSIRKENIKLNSKLKEQSNLSKPLSKSHDNLASTLRKKAVAAALAENSAKDNVNNSPVPGGKFKVPKTPSDSTPIRKAQSHQNIDKASEPIKRTQSAQNISSVNKVALPEQQTKKPTSNLSKRAVSSQNLISKKNNRHSRSNNSSNIAYNAELLASFEKEKKQWERRISELTHLAENRKTENERFKFEVKNLKAQIPAQNILDELEFLRSENKVLKDKLHELGVTLEHSTDNDKLCMLQKEQEKSSVTPPDYTESGAYYNHGSELGRSVDSEIARSHGSIGDLSWVTPEHPSSISLDNNWDKCSNKSDALSEVSVACLQDRILQMEETHYSTSEELQATLQELGDLQDSVNQLSDENELLADEKSVLLDSLCAQTEKLENCRMQIDQLKALLVNDSERGDRSENERQLVALVKSSQEEKEELQLRQMELCNMVSNLEIVDREQGDVIQALKDKANIFELKNESIASEKRILDTQMAELKETTATDQIEIQRYKTLLDNEKQKVSELEQFRNATDKSDIEELLDNTRQEKDKLEDRLTDIQEKLAVSENNVFKHEEINSSLEEQVKVLKNNTKSEVSDLEYKLEKKENEKQELQEEIGTLRDHIDQLQLDCDRYLEDQKTYNATVSKLENDLKSCKQKSGEFEQEAKELKHKYVEDQEEWKQFQADLQTAVVIANDIKMETQEDMEKLQADNQYLVDMKANLESEIECIRVDLARMKQEKDQVSGIRGKVISSLDRELLTFRTTRKPTDPKVSGNSSLSVKNIIHTIEEQVKGTGSGVTSPISPSISPLSPNGSRRDSADSNFSFGSIKSDSIVSPRTPVDRRASSGGDSTLKGLLRNKNSDSKEGRSPISHRHTISGISNIIYESAPGTDDSIGSTCSPVSVKSHMDTTESSNKKHGGLTSILKEPSSKIRRGSGGPEKEQTPEKTIFSSSAHTAQGLKADPLANLAKEMGGSKRNALLTWCKLKTISYSGIDITNFSSSWNDGLAFCAIVHSYLPDQIPYKELNSTDKQRNFTLAFKAAEEVGITSNLTVSDMVAMERPDWQAVMNYVTSIYKHFEVDKT